MAIDEIKVSGSPTRVVLRIYEDGSRAPTTYYVIRRDDQWLVDEVETKAGVSKPKDSPERLPEWGREAMLKALSHAFPDMSPAAGARPESASGGRPIDGGIVRGDPRDLGWVPDTGETLDELDRRLTEEHVEVRRRLSRERRERQEKTD